VKRLAEQFSYDSLISPIGAQDLIKGTLRAHASLNNRPQVCVDDLKFVLMLKPFLPNPFSPYDGQIVKLRAQGRSISQICLEIGKNPSYRQQVQRVLEKAKLRGILDV
jgi:hypothetical protein